MPFFDLNFDAFHDEFRDAFNRYSRGWKPRVDKRTKYVSTVRDIGRGSSNRTDYKPKRPDHVPHSYDEVKAACLESGSLWEDPDFPAEDPSMFFKDPPSVHPDIEWLRPSEICDDPQLFVDGATRMDVNQGILGDCWLLAAVACLSTNETLLMKVVPPDQSFSEDYAGVFRFCLWQYGRWVEVIVDDRLPTHNGKLIYMHSDERNEFWSALLEKAYAKINGSYEALSGGLTSEALEDFTGGIVMRKTLGDEAPSDLFKLMLKAHQKGGLMGCSIDATPDTMESRLETGLIIGHAYSITSVKLVDVETPKVSGQIPMVRVRNPWGDEHEWLGTWSDKSEEWQFIPEEEREEMGLNFDHDGEFWMAFNDFVTNFQRIEICYLGPDTLLEEDGEGGVTRWEGNLQEGGWKRHVNAGGCRNYPESFWTNPQYRITIPEPDDDDEDGLGCIIIALLQKHRRKMRLEGKENATIGYCLYKLEDSCCGTLNHRFFASNKMADRSPAFINTREVSDYHKLPPGEYVVVPSTFEPNEEADFLLRVYSEKPKDCVEMDEETGIAEAEPDDEVPEESDSDLEKEEVGLQAFRDLSGEDGEIDCYELKDLLNDNFMDDFVFDGFSADMCRSMVAMKDADLSGKLDFEDFQSLWKDLMMCKRVFISLDTDGNGYFNSYEFRRVLNKLGLRVSNATFNAVVMRYSDKEGHVRFDDFVACTIKLKTLFRTFKEKDHDGEGTVNFQMDEFLQLCMYA